VPLYVLCYVKNGILLPFANMEKMILALFGPCFGISTLSRWVRTRPDLVSRGGQTPKMAYFGPSGPQNGPFRTLQKGSKIGSTASGTLNKKLQNGIFLFYARA